VNRRNLDKAGTPRYLGIGRVDETFCCNDTEADWPGLGGCWDHKAAD
jgi:hypothetical protein